MALQTMRFTRAIVGVLENKNLINIVYEEKNEYFGTDFILYFTNPMRFQHQSKQLVESQNPVQQICTLQMHILQEIAMIDLVSTSPSYEIRTYSIYSIYTYSKC